jgi:hypothetical protein
VFRRMNEALFGRSMTLERAASDVDAVVAGVASEETTKLLMAFGENLLKSNEERVAALDGKATALVGYSAAILAFLVTRQSSPRGETWQLLLLALAGGFATATCICAGLALRAARNWRNMGEATWFPRDPRDVASADVLGRWYLRAMHQSFQENHRLVDEKAEEVVYAQAFIALSGVCLGLLLIGRLW